MTKRLISLELDLVFDTSKLRAAFAEFLGSLFFQLFGFFVLSGGTEFGVAFTNGFVLAVLIGMFGSISGAHFNPAVTLTRTLLGRISLLRCLLYIVSQVAGALAGAGISYVLLFKADDALVPAAIQDTKPLNALLATTLAIWFFCTSEAVIASEKGPKRIAPLLLGLNVSAIYLAFQKYALYDIVNPARALATALLFVKEDGFNYHYVVWGATALGAIIAAITAYILSGPSQTKSATASTRTSRNEEFEKTENEISERRRNKKKKSDTRVTRDSAMRMLDSPVTTDISTVEIQIDTDLDM